MREQFQPRTEGSQERQREFLQKNEVDQQAEVDEAEAEALLRNTQNFEQIAAREEDQKHKAELLLARDIALAIKEEGGAALVVGGYARDEVFRRMGQLVKPKDIDIEVYGVSFERVLKILETFGRPELVGASYAVIKLKGLDVSVTRRDSKVATGHQGFIVESDATMTVPEAARRRDFTINAMGLDPLTGEIVDPYGGLSDMKDKVLRAVDAQTFAEDPLRVLRAMQFAGRFEFTIDPETVTLCRSLDLKELSGERIRDEWLKLLLKSEHPSIGMEAAKELGVIEQLHPQLRSLGGVPQDAKWHPEGDVWIHTKMAVDVAAQICRREKLSDDEATVIMMAVLCHDFGKPSTTKEVGGRIVSHMHAEQGEEPTLSFLEYLKFSNMTREKIVRLVRDHLFPSLNKEASDSAVRHLSLRLAPATIKELVMVGEADLGGRTLPWHGYPEGESLLKKAEALRVQSEKHKRLLEGRELLARGFRPGKEVGLIVEEMFKAQLEGKFTTLEEGQNYLDEYLKARK